MLLLHGDGHGYCHGDSHGHGHGHSHGDDHGHGHGHAHGDGHGDIHGHGHAGRKLSRKNGTYENLGDFDRVLWKFENIMISKKQGAHTYFLLTISAQVDEHLCTMKLYNEDNSGALWIGW